MEAVKKFGLDEIVVVTLYLLCLAVVLAGPYLTGTA